MVMSIVPSQEGRRTEARPGLLDVRGKIGLLTPLETQKSVAGQLVPNYLIIFLCKIIPYPLPC